MKNTAKDSLRVLLIVPLCDVDATGEAWWGYQFAKHICERVHGTIVTMDRPLCREKGLRGLDCDQILQIRTRWFKHLPRRFSAMAKPSYAEFYWRTRRLIRELLLQYSFDVIHQFTPFAMRYPSPAIGFGKPVVIGPVGGSVPSPVAFRRELRSMAWYTRLRAVDTWRFRWDPWLRQTFRDTALVLGVAPYVRDLLETISVPRFEIMNETGVLELPPMRHLRTPKARSLRLLYVGRVIRSKGVRDAVRAMAHIRDLSDVTLDIVGDGDDLNDCRREACELGVDRCTRFHGARIRTEVDAFYRNADVFLFPSLREPSGMVVIEAMSFGLPLIVADIGGPSYTVSESVGIRVPVTTPQEYPMRLGDAIRTLASAPLRVQEMGREARELVLRQYVWSAKADRMVDLYHSVVSEAV